jgi:hypothetical protein
MIFGVSFPIAMAISCRVDGVGFDATGVMVASGDAAG